MDAGWNPWHGCHKFSAGCQNCYVYRIDLGHGRDPSQVSKNALFDLPVRRGRNGDYKIPPGSTVYTCFSSDFLLEDADGWRPDAWRMMKERDDLRFLFITKRIHRLADCLPADWGEGYENVHICCTMENQEAADKRLPILMDAPVRHKGIVCEPLLGPIDLNGMLGPWAEQLIAGASREMGLGSATMTGCSRWQHSAIRREWLFPLNRLGLGLKKTDGCTGFPGGSSTARQKRRELTASQREIPVGISFQHN